MYLRMSFEGIFLIKALFHHSSHVKQCYKSKLTETHLTCDAYYEYECKVVRCVWDRQQDKRLGQSDLAERPILHYNCAILLYTKIQQTEKNMQCHSAQEDLIIS